MSNISHFKSFSIVKDGIDIKVDLNRFENQAKKAQFWLDNQIMTDMVPLMPHVTGAFVNITRAMSSSFAGTGIVVAAAPPMGRFLYEGKVMVDPVTNSPWARKGAKKVVTEKPLTYSNPRAVPHWFDKAKDAHYKEWEAGVKERAGGGKIG